MSKVVILRPEPGASASLARAEAARIDAVSIPLFEVRPIDWTAPARPPRPTPSPRPFCAGRRRWPAAYSKIYRAWPTTSTLWALTISATAP